MSDSTEPYTIWSTAMPFRKNGTPVVGTIGSEIKPVVIMDAETFKRLVKEPGLTSVQWRVGTFD